MTRFSIYYALAVLLAAAGLFLEDMRDEDLTFWPLFILALVVPLASISVGLLYRRS